MTPLHQASLRSFKRWHPDWEVTVHWGEDGPDARRRSDVWRWEQLSRRGGVWFDLDVLWYGSIEPHLTGRDQITQDAGTPNRDGPERFSIGVCVAQPGSSVYGQMATFATTGLRRTDDDQATGTEVLSGHWNHVRTAPLVDALYDYPLTVVDNLPGHLFYRVPTTHADMDRLWEPGADVPLDGIAMHWYGSRYKGEPHPDSPIGRALAKAFA